MFVVTAVVYLIGALFYDLMGSGELEPWANSSVSTISDVKSENKEVPRTKYDDIPFREIIKI